MRRKALRIAQSMLAKQVGVTTAYISKIEGGHAVPGDQLCLSIAAALNFDEHATRDLRAAALEARTGIKVEEICLHSSRRPEVNSYSELERRVIETIRALDNQQRNGILDYILWIKERTQASSQEWP